MIGWPNGLRKAYQVLPSFGGLNPTKLLSKDKARRIAVELCEAAGVAAQIASG
jgi:hypothetical protein